MKYLSPSLYLASPGGASWRADAPLPLGYARLSTTQKYTRVSLTDLMAVYDRAHPKA
jgi:integrase/recombinase XerC